MNKKVALCMIFGCMAIAAQCQTVVWQMNPTNYNEIIRLNSNLFKVTRNGKVGLINSDGTIVSPVENDNISDCYEHMALLTVNDGHGERITGCLTDDGRFYGFTQKYYTLNGQKFFSDGLISVSDENGTLGYIDKSGNQVVGFDGKYSRIKPFTEGYATVLKEKKYILIDKEGNEMKFMYGGNGVGAVIKGCTNVYHGKAYAYDEYGGSDRSYFVYDALEKSKLKKVGRIKDTAMDYLYCYQAVTGRTKEVPYVKMPPYVGTKGLNPVLVNGTYGYQVGETAVLPSQFSTASQFEDGLAIVSVNGLKGILRYIDGAAFEVSIPVNQYNFYSGNDISCKFNLSIPNAWSGKKLEMLLKDASGNTIATSNTLDSYTFTVKPSASGQVQYHLSIYAEGLKLYEGFLIYSFNKKERCTICGKDKEQCEYRGSHPMEKGKSGSDICKTCGLKISECKYQGVH